MKKVKKAKDVKEEVKYEVKPSGSEETEKTEEGSVFLKNTLEIDEWKKDIITKLKNKAKK